jgi:hypothetical protein
LFLAYLEKEFLSGKLAFCSSLQQLHNRAAFLRHLAPVRTAEWLVYAKPPLGGPQQVLDYVGRYTHRIAISNNRLLSIEDGKVRFRWKDYRNNHHRGAMTLAADEFIRRFLLHVLPEGFQRIRYYGFLCNRHREQKLARCREQLGMHMDSPSTRERSDDYRDRYEAVIGASLKECPVCHHGQMILLEVLPRAKSYRYRCDTS